MPVSEAQKRASAKYRSKNYQRYLDSQLVYNKTFRENNREIIRIKGREKFSTSFRRQASICRRILILENKKKQQFYFCFFNTLDIFRIKQKIEKDLKEYLGVVHIR
jgi:hypothetical protein